ncbi:hypothetical protein I316_04230 [Kwoniella heveanensis BCC8398]|uniref:Dilute domain-containing protein n=1 Tax=Kwoniella heveanensis BCC8398 TaxID=1296120 RepID=A0A1B9GTD0_9TREE|nr:hypothetical protein I316_04230 [Kwoniella heveanensis BCC8398]
MASPILPPPASSTSTSKHFLPPSNPTSASASPNPLHHAQFNHVLVPESPLIDLTLSSPDHRGLQAETSSLHSSVVGGEGGHAVGSSSSRAGLRRANSYKRQPEPRFLNDPSPSNILPLLQAELGDDPASSHTGPATRGGADGADDGQNVEERDRELRAGLILRRAVKWAVERCDVELIGWLVGLEGQAADILDAQVQGLEDEEGWGLVGIAISCSCGRQDKEEGVRAIVGRWGLQVGQRGGRDRTGWTPLHLAALISTPPLISFLLARGASPHALTNRGLTPLDLVVGMPDREDVALFLEHATCHGGPSSPPQTATEVIPHFPPARQAMLERRRRHAQLKLEAMEKEEKKCQMQLERERWIRDRARIMDVDPELVIAPNQRKRESRYSRDSGLGWIGYELDLEAERGDDTESEFGDDDDYEVPLDQIGPLDINSNMLVFSLSHLPVIYDILITNYTPVCQPISRRALPANALFLHARFAQYRCDETWLEELIEGVVESIEAGVYENTENLAYLAFWSYNSTLLLHLLRSDPAVHASCEEMSLLGMMEELINAIHVFVIRVAERRIDTVLDAAVLDYETLEDFNDIRYEGEWSLFRSFAPKKKRETPRAASIFNPSPGPASAFNDASASPSPVSNSPFRTPARHQSMSDLRLGATPRSISHESNVSGTSGHSATPTVDLEMSPARVTDILSGVLLILQLYEVNPAIVVQAFSQTFFWISCELFNRILSQKRYLCRTKALQIKMNITVLDDWVRANGLPAQTATKHLEPVSQLLQWLQCLSQIKEFDMLIGTMQNMKAINPLQMRRAVRDYRYEVNEGKMNEECGQYLAQLQKDWERRRIQVSMQEAERRSSLSDHSHGHGHDQAAGHAAAAASDSSVLIIDESSPVDALFDGTTSLADFTPESAPECLGELLDSRYMLPFLLPEDNAYLIATPPSDAAYRNLLPASPFISDGSRTSRPPSRSSFSSSRPMVWALPKQRKLRELPPDFFAWLKDQETEHRLQRDAVAFKQKRMIPTTNIVGDPPMLGSWKEREMRGIEKSPTPTPTRPIIDTGKANQSQSPVGLLPSLTEAEDISPTVRTATAGSAPFVLHMNGGMPSSGLRSSKSIQELRESSKIITCPDLTSPSSSRTAQQLPHTPDHGHGHGHGRSESYELKLRMQRNSSGQGSYMSPQPLLSPTLSTTSNESGSGGSGKKRWWKLNKKNSSNNITTLFRDREDDSRRKIREGSEDTIGPGSASGGWYESGRETMRTPEAAAAITPTGGEKKKFWS